MEFTIDLALCRLDTAQAESFGMVSSYVAWDGQGLPELCVTVDSAISTRPLANDTDLDRLQLDLANATHCLYDHDKNAYILFNCSVVLGMYRNAITNPTYDPFYRALNRLDLWQVIYTKYRTKTSLAALSRIVKRLGLAFKVPAEYLDPQRIGVKSPLFTVYRKAVTTPYSAIMLNAMAYDTLSDNKKAAVRAHAHYLAKWGMWRVGELLHMDDVERDSWILMLKGDEHVRPLDRLLVEDGIMRRNRLELGEWKLVAKSLLFQLVGQRIITDWNNLADVKALGVDSAFLADLNLNVLEIDLNTATPEQRERKALEWDKINVTVTTLDLLTTVKFSLKAVQV